MARTRTRTPKTHEHTTVLQLTERETKCDVTKPRVNFAAGRAIAATALTAHSTASCCKPAVAIVSHGPPLRRWGL